MAFLYDKITHIRCLISNVKRSGIGESMFRLEKKGLEWIEKHLCIIAIIAVTIIAGYIRLSVRYFKSDDLRISLIPWYDIMKANGQIRALKMQIGNYNLIYQFLIALLTYLPLHPMIAYKFLSCIFDYLLAAAMGCLVICGGVKGKLWKFLIAYSMVLLSPVVVANSATWAQCDSIYTFWLVLSILFLIKEKYALTFLCFGMALAFKLQAIFLLPFLLFAYFSLRKFSFLYFGIAPVTLWCSGIPAFLMGRKFMDVFTIYQLQVTTEGAWFSGHYPSFWLLLLREEMENHPPTLCYPYILYGTAAVLSTVCVLAAWMIWWTYKRVEWSGENLLYAAFLLTYSVVLFLPSMHERYGYVYEILAIGVAVRNKKTLPLLFLLTGITLMTYGDFLFARPVDYYLLSLVNCGIFIAYSYMLDRKMLPKG